MCYAPQAVGLGAFAPIAAALRVAPVRPVPRSAAAPRVAPVRPVPRSAAALRVAPVRPVPRSAAALRVAPRPAVAPPAFWQPAVGPRAGTIRSPSPEAALPPERLR